MEVYAVNARFNTHLLVVHMMVKINTYAPIPTWSGDGVSDSHWSQHFPPTCFPSDSGPGASYLVAWICN